MGHAIEVSTLGVAFGRLVAVRDVSLDVDYGQCHVLLGPNGSGKTTTVETVLGFRRPGHGTVRVMGLDPHDQHREVVSHVGALLQRGGVWFPMSPRRTLELTATYYPSARGVDELLDLCGLNHCATTPWRRLSGGEQQRLLLALALIGRPRILVLDEPTSAVDPEGHVRIRQLLGDLVASGTALLLTTHQLADAEELADVVTIIDEGVVVASGTPRELAGDATLSFETNEPIDAASLASALKAVVVELGPSKYRANTSGPEATAALTAAVAAAGVELVALRTRASLEEAYMDLLARHREAER